MKRSNYKFIYVDEESDNCEAWYAANSIEEATEAFEQEHAEAQIIDVFEYDVQEYEHF